MMKLNIERVIELKTALYFFRNNYVFYIAKEVIHMTLTLLDILSILATLSLILVLGVIILTLTDIIIEKAKEIKEKKGR